MDRIRQALDRARMERGTTLPAAELATGGTIGVIAAAPPGSFVYTHTRVFTPSAAVLEDNRIMDPASAEPAAAAFRMLRTQVLQRMDANGWRSLAIFSPTAGDGKTTTAINLGISLANDQSH